MDCVYVNKYYGFCVVVNKTCFNSPCLEIWKSEIFPHDLNLIEFESYCIIIGFEIAINFEVVDKMLGEYWGKK